VVKGELQGFVPQEQGPLSVGLGKTIEVQFALEVGGLTETVEVIGDLSAVDATTAATDAVVTQDMLFNQPLYDPNGIGVMYHAPGITNSAYGGQSSVGNALLLDGVDTRDPGRGGAWVSFDANLIQEVQVGGLGAAAEYGGFTGAVANTITKSGGNTFSGLFSLRVTNDSLASDNVGAAMLAENPTLGEGSVLTRQLEYTVQLGGPIKSNKAFFFGNIQRYSVDVDPSGPLTKVTTIAPRLTGKLRIQPSPANTFVASLQYDQYTTKGRPGQPGSQSTPNQTGNGYAPAWVWNAQWRRVFGDRTFLEAKLTGYTGYDAVDPVDPSPYTYDGATGTYTGGGGGQGRAERSRSQFNVAVTRYADRFGSHTFKFGAEIERSHLRDQSQPYGPAGFYVYAYGGVPYYQISYGYDQQSDNHRESVYAQDQWRVGRLTLNLGLRLDRIRGYSPVLKENVYEPDLAWGPRLGAAYDVGGKGATVLRAFWGQYFEGTASYFFITAIPGTQDYVSTPILPDGSLGTPEVRISGLYGIADAMKHPRVDEVNVSWEQQFARVWKLTATGVRRRATNFIGSVIDGSRWQPVPLSDPLTGDTFTGYRWANAATTGDDFFTCNVAGYHYLDVDGSVIGTADPRRDYQALILSVNRPFKARWSVQGSYVLAKAEGNVENGFSDTETAWTAYLGGVTWNSPNTALIKRDGELVNSMRHEVKVYAAYQVPKVEVMLAGNYWAWSGQRYTPYQQYTEPTLALPGATRRTIFLEPRGSRHLEFKNSLDVRVEKVVDVGIHRFGLFADVYNVFNAAPVTGVQSRVPSTTISGYTIEFEAPTAVGSARQVFFGGRWSF
jgi:hypothetical protein